MRGRDVDLDNSSWNRIRTVSWSLLSWRPSRFSPSGADRVRRSLDRRSGIARRSRRARRDRRAEFYASPHTSADASSASKKDLLDLLRLRGQLHRRTKEPFLEVAHELHSSPHVIMHRHECGLSSRTKPADQLVTNVRKPGTASR